MGRPRKHPLPAPATVDASSEDEIPPKKKAAPQDDDEHNDDELDDEEEEPEYAVESVEGYKFVGGRCFYHVKWIGYEEMTWEPIEHLDNCPDELDKYHEMIGGPPQPNKKANAAGASSKKRKLDNGKAASSSAKAGTSAKGKEGVEKLKAKSNDHFTIKDARTGKEFLAPRGPWEDHLVSVQTVLQSPLNKSQLEVTIEWDLKNGGHVSTHKSDVIRQKAPNKLIDFYESRIMFQSAPENADEFVDAKSEMANNEDERMSDDLDAFVKDVATSG